MTSLLGQSLGRYHILEQLGEGGMATVYKAFDTHVEREVAVKFIRSEKLTGKNAATVLKRFKREAQALAKLSHPNILTVLDYGEHEGQLYLVTEYLPGGSLKQKLGKPMPYQDAAKLLIPIARALEYAHSQRILHRDVKPANILLSPSGLPVLADFGIAKLLEHEETTELTRADVGIGTPEYMAPEQGKGKADVRSDVYSLGVVFYELVTGRKPYTADTPLAVLMMHATDPLPRPKSFVRELPDGVEQVIFKAMAKKPEDRLRSMAEFANALERLAQSHPHRPHISAARIFAVLGLTTVTVLCALGVWAASRFAPRSFALLLATSTPSATSTLSTTSSPLATFTATALPSPTRTPTPSRTATQEPSPTAARTSTPRFTPAPTTPPRIDTTVVANQSWQSTHVYIAAGTTLSFSATGTWSYGNEGVCCGPNPYDAEGYYDKYDSAALSPEGRVGALIARINGCRPFYVGLSNVINATCSGELQFAMNDVPGTLSDNSGLLGVTVLTNP